jgi:hypothetical protein
MSLEGEAREPDVIIASVIIGSADVLMVTGRGPCLCCQLV